MKQFGGEKTHRNAPRKKKDQSGGDAEKEDAAIRQS